MSTPVTYVGTQYNIPAYQDTGYAQGSGNLSSYLIALATGSLTLSGGTFTLTADADFGANFGLKSIYYKSRNANVATTGVVRLGSAELICWRNNANNDNLELTTDTSDRLTFNGLVIATSTGALVGTTLTLSATSNQMTIGTTNTTTLSFTAPAASRTYTIPDAGGAANFILSAGAQTISGAKTFASSTLLLQEAGSTDVITIAVASLATGRTYTVPDAGGAASFVMTAGTQTLAGATTFSSTLDVTGGSGNTFIVDTSVFVVDATNNLVGLGTTSPSSTANGLDIASGGLSLVLGANSASSTRTNATEKFARIGGYHYTNIEEPVGMIECRSDGTDNNIQIGGGAASENAATNVRFFTAANVTTTTGSERMRIDSGGRVAVGTTSPSSYNTSADDFVVANSAASMGITLRTATNSNNTIAFTDAEGTTVQGMVQYLHNATAGSEYILFRVGGSDWFVFNGAGGFMPAGTTGTQNIGDGTTYWGDISYKTLTDRGCLPWCDEGVELMDGRIVSDLEALCQLQKHPTKKTVTGLPRLDYQTFPKHSFKRVEDEFNNFMVERDMEGNAWVTKEIEGRKEKMAAEDGVEMTMLFGVMIGAFKEVSKRLQTLETKTA